MFLCKHIVFTRVVLVLIYIKQLKINTSEKDMFWFCFDENVDSCSLKASANCTNNVGQQCCDSLRPPLDLFYVVVFWYQLPTTKFGM